MRGAAYLVLIAGAIWLWGFPAATLPYYLMVGLHPLLGVAVLIAGWFDLRAWLAGTWSTRGIALLHIVTALTGLVILVVGATTPYRNLVSAHSVMGALAAAWLGRTRLIDNIPLHD